MFSKLHERLGTAGLVVAVIALVVALGGSAVAALSGADKKEVKKIAKKFAGKPGKRGPAGKPGAPGAQGPAGAPGAPGAKGDTGAAGAKGATGAAGAKGATGADGAKGATGLTGATGATGATGPVGPTLPSGVTLTGAWGDFSLAAGLSGDEISFPIPLASAPTVKTVDAGKIGTENATECPGYVNGRPTAAKGFLCVYVSNETGGEISNFFNPNEEEAASAAPNGVVLLLELDGEGPLFGSWAVTAP